MKKIFLLLTITLAQAQVCLANSAEIAVQSAVENSQQTKDNKPQTWREYFDSKVASTKNRLNNGYLWVKKNPKTTGVIVVNIAIICALTYAIVSYKSANDKLSANVGSLQNQNDKLLGKVDTLRGEKASLDNKVSTLQLEMSQETNDYGKKISALSEQNQKLAFDNGNLAKEKDAYVSQLRTAYLDKNKVIEALNEEKNKYELLAKKETIIKAIADAENLREANKKLSLYRDVSDNTIESLRSEIDKKAEIFAKEKTALVSEITEQKQKYELMTKPKDGIEKALSDKIKQLYDEIRNLKTLSEKQEYFIKFITQNEYNVVLANLREAAEFLLRENEALKSGVFPWIGRDARIEQSIRLVNQN